MMRSSSFLCFLSVCLAACGGGGDDESKPASPKAIPGGGIAGPALSGHADVFVLEVEGQPLAGASVWIGEGANAKNAGTTDANGYLAIDDAALVSGAVISATATSHVGATYAGVDGSLSTFVLAVQSGAQADVSVSGTITGWDALPDPAPGKYRAARVVASRPVDLASLDAISAQKGDESCFRPAGQSAECAFTLMVHPASESLLAVIVEGDDSGTPGDRSDDALEATTLAIGPGPGKGGATTGATLGILAEADLARASVTLGKSSGLVQVIGVPGVGDNGQATIFPLFDSELPSYRVPRAVGDLASSTLWGVGVGSDAAGDSHSLVLVRGMSAANGTEPLTISLEDFLEAPSVTKNGDAFELMRTSAGIHALGLRGTSDHDIWILDDRASVTLPAAIDLGTPSVEVSASEIPGDFHPGTLADELSRRARQRL